MSIPLPNIPVGGRTKYFINEWFKITHDPFVIECIKGCKLDLINDVGFIRDKKELKMSQVEMSAGDLEIEKLLAKNAIVKCSAESEQCVSNVFLRAKSDSGWRIILNLKSFNSWVLKLKFKMETLDHIVSAMSQGCYMTTLDLSDAYLTLPVNSKYWKYLKFRWRGQLYIYIVLPFGLTSAPRIFTKVSKALVSHLHRNGHIVIFYLDDGWQCSSTFEECERACHATLRLLTCAGSSLKVQSLV